MSSYLPYIFCLLAAAAVTYLLTPLVRRFASAVGASHAARDRDVHVVPTPLLGGFAMYGGLAVALLLASRVPALSTAFDGTNIFKGLLMAGGLLVIMGFVDDRWGMGVWSKLAGQVAAGVILVWSGAAINWLPKPGGNYIVLSQDEQTVVTILVVVATINAVNFIDGLDGLAAGVVGIGAAALFIYYFTLVSRLGLGNQAAPALVSAILAGVCLGFLPHNFHPARIFMGDTGAMLIGLLLAYAPISSLSSLDPEALTRYGTGAVNRFGEVLPLLLPAAIMLIPYADLFMAVFRRSRAGMSPFAPDKKHLHHRLLNIGHSHRTTVLIMYLWAALFAGSVVWLSIVTTPVIVLAGVSAAAMLGLLLLSMPRLRPWARSAPAAAGQVSPFPGVTHPAPGPPPAVPGALPAEPVTPSPAGALSPASRQGEGLPVTQAAPPAPSDPGPDRPWASAVEVGMPRRGAETVAPGAPVPPGRRARSRR